MISPMLKCRTFISGLLILIAQSVWAYNIPDKSSRLVNDYTQTLSTSEQQMLEQKLLAYNDSTSTQVAIVIIPSLDGEEVSAYAVKLAEQWGIGRKDKDNGVLLLISIQDRRVTIQTGYGMEGVLPDAICKRIIEQEIKPAFQQSDYYGGIDKATTAIFKFAAGEYTADNYAEEGTPLFFILILIAFIIFVSIMSRRKGKHQQFSSRGSGIPFWMLMGGGGSRSHGGSWGNFSGGSGGFRGFGGGSFGGGGASGGW